MRIRFSLICLSALLAGGGSVGCGSDEASGPVQADGGVTEQAPRRTVPGTSATSPSPPATTEQDPKPHKRDKHAKRHKATEKQADPSTPVPGSRTQGPGVVKPKPKKGDPTFAPTAPGPDTTPPNPKSPSAP